MSVVFAKRGFASAAGTVALAGVLSCLLFVPPVLLACLPSPARGCAARPSGLISWWAAEGSAHDNTAGNDGVIHGGVTFPAGEVGTAFSFVSDSDRVVVPNELSLGVQAAGFTVDFWMKGIKNQPGPSLACLIDKSHGAVDASGWVFQANTTTGLPSFAIGNGGGFTQVDGAVDVLDGAFHHIAGTWGSNVMHLYVDGVSQGTAVLSTPSNNTRSLNMGSWWGGGTPQRFYRGLLDEVHLFDRELPASEVQSLFAAGSSGMCRPSGPCDPSVVRDIPSTVPEPGDPAGRPAWVRTGVFVHAGDVLTVIATGDVNDGGGFSAGPDGNFFPGDPQSQFPDWYQSVAHLALIGRLRLASDTTQVVPLDDGANANGLSGPGFVGSAFSATMSGDGSVELAVNDGDSGNNTGSYQVILCPPQVLGVPAEPGLKLGLSLAPNPARDGVHLVLSLLPFQRLWLQVFDLKGRCVRTLIDGDAVLSRSVRWDGRDAAGRSVAPGLYLIRARTETSSRTIQAVLLR